jgi:polyhydroxybutyrate depolymerase
MRLNTFDRLGPVLIVMALAAGCTEDEALLSEDSGETVRASAGCGLAAPASPGESSSFTLRVGELDREYLLHLPPEYDPEFPVPLVLDFHGYTGISAGEETYTGLSHHADHEGYAVVYPQGTGFAIESGDLITSWNDLAGSASSGPAGPVCSQTADYYPHPPECGEPRPCVWASCHDDLGFIDRLLDRLETELCIDLDRVYATGMSNGGMFVHRLGCEMPERFAAIVPVGGTLARGFNCAPDAPLAMMNIYGTRDIYVSQRGDMSSDGYYYESAEAVMTKWAEAQECDSTTTVYETSQDGILDVACVQHDNCSTGAEVVHCTWDGAHDWPEAGGQPFGNEIIWEFFSTHSRAQYGPAQKGQVESS